MARHPTTVVVILLFLAGLLAGCQADPMNGEIVQIGSTKAPFLGPPQMFRDLHLRLEKLFDRRVVFRVQPDGPGLADQLAQGNYAYAILSARELCAIDDTSALTILATGINKLGQSSRKAYIVLRANSHLKEIGDCESRRFAFGRYRDLLTDIAARAALEKAGIPPKNLLPELLTPPPIGLEGRLYLGHDVARTIIADITVNAGVVDEVDYEAMPETGGNFILGPSKDQFKIVGETVAIPEMSVVAGPGADEELTARLRDYLFNDLKKDEKVCQQLGVAGFAEPDGAAFEAVRKLLATAR